MRKLTGEKLEAELARLEGMRAYEHQYENAGIVCGIDEAGRGPLAGPVVAAVAVLPKDCTILRLNDSKKLSEKCREELFLEIKEKAAAYGIGIVSPEVIDSINILQATYEAMRQAVAQLPQGHVAESTTANIGKIGGGSGTNIVSESCLVEGEIRSLNHETAMELLATYQKTFQQEADAIGAKLVWEEKLNIHAYETPLTGVAAKHYESAVAKEGLTAAFEKTFGGSDNNVFAQHGIEGLVIATSMNQVHSCAEYTKIPEIAQVARIVANLAALQED